MLRESKKHTQIKTVSKWYIWDQNPGDVSPEIGQDTQPVCPVLSKGSEKIPTEFFFIMKNKLEFINAEKTEGC